MPTSVAVALLVFVVGLLTARSYNRVVRSQVRTDEAWAGIDVQLKRRANLVPALVETVQGYADHEKRAFEAVAEGRAVLLSAEGPVETIQANLVLTRALGRVLALSEAYPELKASTAFLGLQEELSDIEEKIAYARQFYNRNVLDYNIRIRSFPTLLLARSLGFRSTQFFEAGDLMEGASPEPPTARP